MSYDEFAFKIHHFGLAVRDIEAATLALLPMGATLSTEFPDTVDEGLGVSLRFLVTAAGAPLLELVAGLSSKSPVSAILSKGGPSLYHICYEVLDLENAAAMLRDKGYIAVSRPMPAKAFAGRLIQFLHHPESGLIELLAGGVS